MSENSGDRSLKNSLQGWLTAAGSLIGVASAASFVLTAVYDWGFFSALGLKLSEVPTTLSDHLRGALNWMPAVLSGLGLAVLISAIWSRLGLGKSMGEVIAKSKFPKRARFVYELPLILLGVACVGGLLLYFALGDRFLELLLYSAPLLWALLAVWLLPKRPLDKLNLLGVIVAVLILPSFVILAFIWGRSDSLTLRKAPESTQVQLLGQAAPVSATVVRTIDKGLLVLMKGGTEVRFFPWTQIVRVVAETKPPFEGFAPKCFHGR